MQNGFHTLSAILRGKWLIEHNYAMAHLPMVAQMIDRNNQAAYDNSAAYKGRLHNSEIEENKPARMTMAHAAANVYSVNPYSSLTMVPEGSIAMVNITGPILKYGDYCTYGSLEYASLFNKLSKMSGIKGIIANIDSPGGQVDGTATLADTINQVSQIKPVIGIVQDGMAASAGYWIASACNELYATQATDMFGSIGAFTTLIDYVPALEKMGVVVKEIYAPQSADKNKAAKDALADKPELVQEELRMIVEKFIGAVKQNRSSRLDTKANDPFTGKMFFAKEAQQIGLIDGIQTMDYVVNRVEQLSKLF